MKETGIRRSLPEATELVHAFRYIACGQTQITCDSNFWLAYTKEYIDDKEQSGILWKPEENNFNRHLCFEENKERHWEKLYNSSSACLVFRQKSDQQNSQTIVHLERYELITCNLMMSYTVSLTGAINKEEIIISIEEKRKQKLRKLMWLD